MAGQIALALVLVIASGLMVRSFQKLRSLDPGFDPSSALTFRVGLPAHGYPDRIAMVAAHRAMLDRLSALPGVAAASASTGLPLDSGLGWSAPVFVEARPLVKGGEPPLVAIRVVAADYFKAMGMRLLSGRGVDWADIERNERVAVVDQRFARVLFPGEDPIGRRVRLPGPADSPVWLAIVGVVPDTPTRALGETRPVPKLYMPMFTERRVGPQIDGMTYVVRSATAPTSLVGPVRAAIKQVDADLALAQVKTLQDIVDMASAQTAFTMVLLVVAAGVALMLGVIGIYGAMSYIVSQRTGEIGVRLALGAPPGSVTALIVRQGGIVAFIGVVIGLAAAAAGSRLIESLLYSVSPRDPAIFTATTLALLSIALMACWLPARRAARLDPLDALRSD
jgi:putative ABC transport system permease protein